METDLGAALVSQPPVQEFCPVCHQPVLPTQFFCSNCGTKLHAPPLPTDPWTQTWIYAFSIVLPVICYLLITKWPGLKYIRSQDPAAKQIGVIAFALIIISSIITFWIGTIWVDNQIQSSFNEINQEMGA